MPVPSGNIHIFVFKLMDPCNCSGDLIEEDMMAGSRSTHGTTRTQLLQGEASCET